MQIEGPRHYVEQLFNESGIIPVEQNSPGCGTVLTGHYNCSQPPKIGFQFGPNFLQPVMHIHPSALKQTDNGNNNCTASIVGSGDDANGSSWILGKPFFHGKYLDFNVDQKRVGVAYLNSTEAQADDT